jgi:hypothetical protein
VVAELLKVLRKSHSNCPQEAGCSRLIRRVLARNRGISAMLAP